MMFAFEKVLQTADIGAHRIDVNDSCTISKAHGHLCLALLHCAVPDFLQRKPLAQAERAGPTGQRLEDERPEGQTWRSQGLVHASRTPKGASPKRTL